MVGFLIGLFVGGLFGAGIMAVCNAASNSDPSDLEEQSKYVEEYLKRKKRKR